MGRNGDRANFLGVDPKFDPNNWENFVLGPIGLKFGDTSGVRY